MRRSRAPRAGVAAAVVVPGIASAATGPAPGSPAYIARDTRNIAGAYGRQTAPYGQLTPSTSAPPTKRSYGPRP